MAKGSIRARVQCIVEIPVGVWSGGQTDLDSLTEQVKREGAESIRQMIFKQFGTEGAVIGSPRVFFVVLSEDRDVKQ